MTTTRAPARRKAELTFGPITSRSSSSPSLELKRVEARRSRHRVPRSDVAPRSREPHVRALTLTRVKRRRGPRLAPARSLQSTAPRFRLRCANDRIRRLITPSRFRALTCVSRSFIRVHQARTDLQVSPMAKPARRVTPSAARRFAVESACRCLRATSIATPSPGGGRHVGDVESLAQHQGSGQPHGTGSPVKSLAPELGLPVSLARQDTCASTAPARSTASRYCTRRASAANDFWLLHTVRRDGVTDSDALHRALDHCTLRCTERWITAHFPAQPTTHPPTRTSTPSAGVPGHATRP